MCASNGEHAAPVANVPCIGLRPREAAAMGISQRKLWEISADRDSRIPVVRFGKSVVYPVRELTDWLASRANGKARK